MIDPIPAHWEGPRRIAELEARIAAALAEECRPAHAEGCCGCPVYRVLAGGTDV